MAHDPRLIKHEDTIEDLKPAIPDWIKNLKRPGTPCVVPAFGPLEGIRAVGTGVLIAQPYIGTKLAEFGAEVIHTERPGGDVFRFTAPQLIRGPRPHGCDEAEVTKNKLSMGLDLKHARGIELLMKLWKISDGILGPRDARTQRDHQRVGAGGQPEPRHRAGQHLRAIRQGGVLRVLKPLGVNAAVRALEAQTSQTSAAQRQLELALQQARFSAAHARRQYDAVDPANRLVAGELERPWNEALQVVHRIEGEIAAL